MPRFMLPCSHRPSDWVAHLRIRRTWGQPSSDPVPRPRCTTRFDPAAFAIGTTTVYRYITEVIDLLGALAPTLEQAVREASRKAFVLLDGAHLPLDRIAADRPSHSGKHKKHGMNVQVLADPAGRSLWPHPPSARPGGTAATASSVSSTAALDIDMEITAGKPGPGDSTRTRNAERWRGPTAG
jgi:hypothetical protein